MDTVAPLSTIKKYSYLWITLALAFIMALVSLFWVNRSFEKKTDLYLSLFTQVAPKSPNYVFRDTIDTKLIQEIPSKSVRAQIALRNLQAFSSTDRMNLARQIMEKQVDPNPFVKTKYKSFSHTSVLIDNKNYMQAIEDAESLKDLLQGKLIKTMQYSYLEYFEMTYLYTYIRLLHLYKATQEREKMLNAAVIIRQLLTEEIHNSVRIRPSSSRKILKTFSTNDLTLIDYLDSIIKDAQPRL